MPTAFVTGSGVRVGRAIALALANAGYDLVLHAHSSVGAATEVAAEVRTLGRRATVCRGDLATAADVEALARSVTDHCPVLDVIVHNAAVFERRPFEEVTPACWSRMLAINLECPFFLTQRLLPCLRAAPQPSVVFITDAVACDRAERELSHYSASKAGLAMLTRALAVELAPHIRVNAVAPGPVAWPEWYTEADRDQIAARIPMRRAGTPDDIARAVVFLATQAGYVAGHTLAVDGGWSSAL